MREPQSIEIKGKEVGDATVGPVGTQAGERLHPLLATVADEAERFRATRVDLREPWTPPRPFNRRRDRVATFPDADIRLLVVADDDRGMIEGRGKKRRASVREMVFKMDVGRLVSAARSASAQAMISSLCRPVRHRSSSRASSGNPLALKPAARTRVIRSCSHTPRIPSSTRNATQPLRAAPPSPIHEFIWRGPAFAVW